MKNGKKSGNKLSRILMYQLDKAFKLKETLDIKLNIFTMSCFIVVLILITKNFLK